MLGRPPNLHERAVIFIARQIPISILMADAFFWQRFVYGIGFSDRQFGDAKAPFLYSDTAFLRFGQTPLLRKEFTPVTSELANLSDETD